MKGEIFTKIGLVLFFFGIVFMITWSTIYSQENDVIIDGKISPQTGTSRAILTTATVTTALGYIMCVAGFAISSDVLHYALKMHKNNLIEK